jgi:membrane protease YdiL (CAAX protease family)
LIRTINAGLNWLILLTPRWLPVLVLIPVLYLIGWVKAQLLTLVGLPTSAVSLVGTVFSFLLFLLLMPRWIRLRWPIKQPWVALGLRGMAPHQPSSFSVLFHGLLWSVFLLALIVLPLLLGHWAQFQRTDSVRLLLDAFVLLFGVGLAEELLFRGWLWEELNQLLGAKAGVISQAAIFSLVHTRFNMGVWPMLGLLSGLFLLGLVLALRRRLDHGSLWGCVGLHGGLISGWFLLDKNALQLSADAPAWLIGPGGNNPNPLGGLVAIGALTFLLWLQRRAFSKSLFTTTGHRNAS